MNERKTHLDAMRILACFLVIVNHTNSRVFLSFAPSATWFISLTYFFISKTAVPMFLLISGALLLKKQDGYKNNSVRFWRILEALVIFSFLYYIRNCAISGSAVDIREFFAIIYRGSITNAFWYLYLYLGVLIMLPLLQRAVSAFKKKDYLYFCGVSLLILGSLPIIKHYFPSLKESAGLHLPVFSAYLGLMAAGHYFENVCPPGKKIVKWAAALLLLCIVLSVIGTYYEYKNDSFAYLFFDDRTSVLITVPSVCIYILFKHFYPVRELKKKTASDITGISVLTFGTYLLSDMIIEMTETLYRSLSGVIHPMASMLIWELTIFIICLILTWLLRKLSYFRKLL